MRILVLGGTAFLGRAFVEHAVASGHELTLFNRGKSNPGLFPNIEQIHGDRSDDLDGLDGRTWDAVFDSSGYFPRVVGLSAEKLKDSVRSYLFISSISVFKNMDVPGQDESGELGTLSGPVAEKVEPETYGPMKVLCEQEVLDRFGEMALIVRPGLIVGPYDTTDRFTYWPVRMRRGGDVLVPHLKDQPVQIIDVRDLVEWCLRLLVNKASGVFNATGPWPPYQLDKVLDICAAGTSARLVWVEPKFLEEQGVRPWADLPLVLGLDGSGAGMLQIDVSKAIAAGLSLRPLLETVRDTADWAATRGAGYQLKAGLSTEREGELLAKWFNASSLSPA